MRNKYCFFSHLDIGLENQKIVEHKYTSRVISEGLPSPTKVYSHSPGPSKSAGMHAYANACHCNYHLHVCGQFNALSLCALSTVCTRQRSHSSCGQRHFYTLLMGHTADF